jgi:GNAT superfamily N-acetyltransferase
MSACRLETALHVRPLTAADSLEELIALLHRSYAALAQRGLNYTAADQSLEVTKKRIENRRCFVAVDRASLVGTILVNPRVPNMLGTCFGRPEVASVHQFAVAPEYQRRGLGSLLLEHAERWVKGLGFREIALDTAEPATDLVAFYDRRGYRLVGAVQWEEKVYRSLILCKQLAGASDRPPEAR